MRVRESLIEGQSGLVGNYRNVLMKSADDMRSRGIGQGEENLSFGWSRATGITAWLSSVAAGKGNAGTSRPDVSCRGMTIGKPSLGRLGRGGFLGWPQAWRLHQMRGRHQPCV